MINEIESQNIQELNVFDIIKKVLAFHDCDEKQIEQLLTKQTQLTPNHSVCVEMAVKRILQAQEKKEKVFIGGDYDADGICATTILFDTLKQMDIDVGYYIPDRIKEGYGLKAEVVQQAYDKGYSLIITVDNGVRADEALKKASELGIEVMVTDHHEYETEPQCTLFVHPKKMDPPFQTLSGTGVVLQLAQALIGASPLHLGLAAIATMGDVMPLWDENRVIVRLGLNCINHNKLDVIQSLFSSSTKNKTEQDLAFQIVPKLNATGRLREIANPNQVVRYFLLKDKNEIQNVASQLTEVNEKRKQLTLQMSVLAEKNIEEEPFIILNDSRYHEGIIGILASKIANKYNRPTLVFTDAKEGYKGSGRSIPGFDMQEFFLKDFDEFAHFGGHAQAVGCTVDKDKFDQFKKKIYDRYQSITPVEKKEEACFVDASEMHNQSFEAYQSLAPFGQGFEDVLFAIEGLKVDKVVWIKQKFVKVLFSNGWEGICFEPNHIHSFEEFKHVYAHWVKNTYGKTNQKFSFVIKNME